MTRSLTRRERLMATLRGAAVDRPAVSLYEIGGLRMDPTDPDPFNVYSDPSWQPLLELAEQETDLIRLRSAVRAQSHVAWDRAAAADAQSVRDELLETESWEAGRLPAYAPDVRVGGRELTSQTRRDKDVDTLWTVEHLLKDRDDLRAYLQLPDEFFDETMFGRPAAGRGAGAGRPWHRDGRHGRPAVCGRDAAEHAGLHDRRVHRESRCFISCWRSWLGRFTRRTEQVAREFPGRLWRIYGPEYAAEPYLPPRLFDEYVVRYVTPMVDAIHAHGGFARIHCHGRIAQPARHDRRHGRRRDRSVGAAAAGRRDAGLSPATLRRATGAVRQPGGGGHRADGARPIRCARLPSAGARHGRTGRGFVLMPTACPVGRKIEHRTLLNYQTIVRRGDEWKGMEPLEAHAYNERPTVTARASCLMRTLVQWIPVRAESNTSHRCRLDLHATTWCWPVLSQRGCVAAVIVCGRESGRCCDAWSVAAATAVSLPTGCRGGHRRASPGRARTGRRLWPSVWRPGQRGSPATACGTR